MATWESLRRYIKSAYNVTDDDLDHLRLIFNVGNGRTQNVIVAKQMLGEDEWAEIWTPICEESQISARDALLRNAQIVVGAIGLLEGGGVIFRHSIPLKDLDLPEFEVPFHMITHYGDKLEQEFAGVDIF
jgi:hypothetical protein